MPYLHLALEERYVIYHLVLYGLSYREILILETLLTNCTNLGVARVYHWVEPRQRILCPRVYSQKNHRLPNL